MMDIEIFSKAGAGKHNEDYVLHAEFTPDISLIVVCDGMGGLSYGAEASKLIAQSIESHLRKTICATAPTQSIINAIIYANDELAKECVRLKSKMGASIALALFVSNHCYYTWFGDVRIYLARGGNTELLTNDHLAIKDNHSFLSRCINGKELRHTPEVKELVINRGEEVFIATDGYYLHNKLESPIEQAIIADDDATVARIS